MNMVYDKEEKPVDILSQNACCPLISRISSNSQETHVLQSFLGRYLVNHLTLPIVKNLLPRISIF